MDDYSSRFAGFGLSEVASLIAGLPEYEVKGCMMQQEQKSGTVKKEALLAGRRFAELSDAEKKLYGDLHNKAARQGAKAIADNLNRQVLASDS